MAAREDTLLSWIREATQKGCYFQQPGYKTRDTTIEKSSKDIAIEKTNIIKVKKLTNNQRQRT